MEIDSKVQLPRGGAMPVMGFGTWRLTDDTPGTVEAALRTGYRMIDTAEDYGTQPGIGEALRRSDVDRDRVFLVTKVEENQDAYRAVVGNLGEIGVDHSDLVLIHRPPPNGVGADLWEGLVRARDEGLAGHIGVSNYSMEGIDELAADTGVMPEVNQVEWSPFGRSQQFLEGLRDRDIVLQAYSPLTRATRLGDPGLTEVAVKYGKTPAQLLLRWNVQLGVVPLPKANQHDHLVENADIFDFEISDDDMAALGALNERYSSLGTLPYV